MEEEEHEVYGGEIPDIGEMDGDMEAPNPDFDMAPADDDAVKELEEMKKRLKEMEDEAAALREMHAKVEKEMGAQDPASIAANQAGKEEVDARSVFVGNKNAKDPTNTEATIITAHRDAPIGNRTQVIQNHDQFIFQILLLRPEPFPRAINDPCTWRHGYYH